MKRSALLLALLLAALPALGGPKNHGTITTRAGKSFFDCKITRIYPDGVGFTHRDGAAKIAFKDLPEKLRQEFRYDPRKEAEYQREQAARREDEKKRARLHEIAMEEKLAEARMAEAGYFAAVAGAASSVAVKPLMSPALPGESLPVLSYQTPSWVGTPITGTALGGSAYRRVSSWGGYPFGCYGGGYSYPAYGYGYSYPYHGHGCMPAGAYVSPTIYRSWSVGGGFRVGVGITPFGGGIRLFP